VLWYESPNNKRYHGNAKQFTVTSSIFRSPQEEKQTKTNQQTQDLREKGEKILLTWEAIQEFTMDPL